MTEGSAVLLEGRVSIREDEEPKILCESLVSLDGVAAGEKPPASAKADIDTKRRTLFIRMGTMDDTVIKMAAELLKEHRGNTPVCFYISDTKKRLYAPESCYIDEESGIIDNISAIFGENNVKMG